MRGIRRRREGVELSVKEITKESDPEVYEAYYEKALSGLQDKYDEKTALSFARFYDIKFVYNGEEVEPSGDVKVRIEYKKAVEIEKETTVDAVHFDKNNGEEPEVIDSETTAEKKGRDDSVKTVEFESDQFSVYGIIGSYTVDFHWEVDGKTYEFSIPGGGLVTLEQLAEALDLAEDPHAFAADVDKAVFSDPDLVWVGKAAEETTVGGLKDAGGLECEYSAELTEEQIEDINAQPVKAGDWALISMRPFTSEETLTVTMKDGEVFTILVTDAQISTHVITAKGERFRITVTYGEEAKIPDGSVLTAEEIPEGSGKYEKYLEETSDKWEKADREGYISFARFFDVEIRKDGAKIEPKAPVEVKIEHDDGLAVFEDESLSVIHFAESGTEIIDEIHRNEDSTQVVYEQDSFSVIGTVATVKDSGWPTSNGRYVLILQDGDDYYALNQDGSLAKVRYFNNTVSFIGAGTTTTDYINDYRNGA